MGPTRHLLAGDVGGTKADLALFTAERSGPSLLREATFASRDFGSLSEVLVRFLTDGPPGTVVAAAFGLPGPVLEGRVRTTNLPWPEVSLERLATDLGGAKVRLMNDLEATAYGALFLAPDGLRTLNRGVSRPGHRAVIAAGTGLGQAILHWDGTEHVPVATEGGHVDFAPRDETADGLLRFLRGKFGEHVSAERVISGPGLRLIFDYVDQVLGKPVAPEVRAALSSAGDPSAVIGRAALAGGCPASAEAMAIFVRAYGVQAGNLALTVMATSGVYVGGGIATKILPALESGNFLKAFAGKGRYAELMASIPVWVILDPKTARLGAAMAARALLDDG